MFAFANISASPSENRESSDSVILPNASFYFAKSTRKNCCFSCCQNDLVCVPSRLLKKQFAYNFVIKRDIMPSNRHIIKLGLFTSRFNIPTTSTIIKGGRNLMIYNY